MPLNRIAAAKLDARAVFTHTAEEVWNVKAGIVVIARGGNDAGRGKIAVYRRDELCAEFGKVATDEGAQVARLIPESERGFDLGEDCGVGFEKAFRGGVDFYAAAWKIEECVSTALVVERVVAACWDGAVEVLEIEDVRSGFVAAFCGGDDAFEQEWVGDANDEGAWSAAVNADALEVCLHGHVGLYDAGIGDRTDEVDEGGDGFAG